MVHNQEHTKKPPWALSLFCIAERGTTLLPPTTNHAHPMHAPQHAGQPRQPGMRTAQQNSEYTLVHTVRYGDAVTEAKEPKQTTTQQPRPAPLQWTLYRLLANAPTLAEHSIQPYTDVTYFQRMLQDWTKYETEHEAAQGWSRVLAPGARMKIKRREQHAEKISK